MLHFIVLDTNTLFFYLSFGINHVSNYCISRTMLQAYLVNDDVKEDEASAGQVVGP